MSNNYIPIPPFYPFKNWVCNNFPFIEETFDGITNYQLMSKIVGYLNLIKGKTNELGEQVQELQNWFDNLDVQDEIDNKLDEMAQDGTLDEMITAYINLKGLLCYDTVADLKTATNLINGSYAKTLGFYNVNDKGGATYKIREISLSDVVDNATIIALNDDLVAELIFEDSFLKISQLGLIEGDDDTNGATNKTILEKAITYCTNSNIVKNIKFDAGIYCINSGIIIEDNISLYGVPSNNQAENVNSIAYKGGTILKDVSIQSNENDFITYYNENNRIWGAIIDGIYFKGENYPHHKCLNLKSIGWDFKINNVTINQFVGGAIYFNDCYDGSITNLTIVDSDGIYDNVVHYALTLDDTINVSDSTNALHFTNCHFEISQHLLYLGKARQNCFTNCKFEFGNVPSDSNPQINISENTQDTQFIGCSFVCVTKSRNDQPYLIDVKSTSSLRNTMFEGCEFIQPTGAYKVLKSVGGTIINGCSFQLLVGENYGLYLDGRCILTNNYLRTKDTSVSGGVTEVIYLNNGIASNNMFEHVGGGTNIANTRLFTFKGDKVIVSNNSNTDIYTQPYYFDASQNNGSKLDRNGVITLDETKLTNLYGIDWTQNNIVIPLNLNDVKGAKVIRFNVSKQITITDIAKPVGQDNIMISATNQAVKISNGSSTAGSRILTPTNDNVVVFANQLCDLHFCDFYWRTGYYSTLHA